MGHSQSLLRTVYEPSESVQRVPKRCRVRPFKPTFKLLTCNTPTALANHENRATLSPHARDNEGNTTNSPEARPTYNHLPHLHADVYDHFPAVVSCPSLTDKDPAESTCLEDNGKLVGMGMQGIAAHGRLKTVAEEGGAREVRQRFGNERRSGERAARRCEKHCPVRPAAFSSGPQLGPVV